MGTQQEDLLGLSLYIAEVHPPENEPGFLLTSFRKNLKIDLFLKAFEGDSFLPQVLIVLIGFY